MLINVDISTGAMYVFVKNYRSDFKLILYRYKPGPLLSLCLEYIGKEKQPMALSPRRGFPDRERVRLQRFILGLRVVTNYPDAHGRKSSTPRVIKKLSVAGASNLEFNMRDGTSMNVAQYFQQTYNKPLRFPELPCVEVGSGALLPLELCEVPGGQIMRKQVPPEKTKDVLEFATKKPTDRLASIRSGLSVLSYGQSEYVRQFGMHVQSDGGPLKVSARVLPPPTLRYGQGSRQPAIVRIISYLAIVFEFTKFCRHLVTVVGMSVNVF